MLKTTQLGDTGLEITRVGFGAWALLDLLARDGLLSAAPAVVSSNPLAAKAPHFPARAKHVIFLFMQGGPSHIDTFDPKPLLTKLHGQPLPASATAGLQLQFTVEIQTRRFGDEESAAIVEGREHREGGFGRADFLDRKTLWSFWSGGGTEQKEKQPSRSQSSVQRRLEAFCRNFRMPPDNV